ncbi:uncharacterized protein LOC110100904, partial [Dendrobium catenatum]|uniref:uncharacterized protein LOC110100904 n=1 Tax=Dendrobium catenatum TaxID=906689 RepID=UPI0009F6B3B1
EIINFPSEDIVDAVDEWDLALVGYSLGKRPYYEALLTAVKNLWNLKVDATVTFPEIIPICVDGKIFNLKIQYEWHPTLCAHCRSLNHLSSNCSANPNSDINSIANPPRGRSKSRRPRPHSQNPKGLLPLPNSSNTIPELATNPLEKNGDISLNRDDINAPNLDNNVIDNSNQNIILANHVDYAKTKGLITEDGVGIQSINEIIETTLNIESSPLLGSKDPTPILTGTNIKIPNLNSPTSLNSSSNASTVRSEGQNALRIFSSNKFSVLRDANEAESSSSMLGENTGDPIESTAKYKNDKLEVSTSNKLHSSDPSSQRQTRGKGNRKAWNIRGFNNPEKVLCCRNLVNEHRLDLICILENRINSSNLLDPWFCSTHKVEFGLNGIQIKFLLFPFFSSSQMISGQLMMGSQSLMILSTVYASNSFDERNKLWADLGVVNPQGSLPWVVICDFNTCRFQSEKKGGNILAIDRLNPINSFIFDNNLLELPSSGNFHTRFNQRLDNPIHLKLDRVLVNEAWINHYPNSHYLVLSSLVSNHTPLILRDHQNFNSKKRFMYKNYWSHIPDFWSILLNIFQTLDLGNPIVRLYKKLKLLKREIKARNWSNSNLIAKKCASMAETQSRCQRMVDNDPLNRELCGELKKITAEINYYNSLHASWIIQRSKINWLKNGEEDLKFLYSKIRNRKAFNGSSLVAVTQHNYDQENSNIPSIIQHFQNLYNSAPPEINDVGIIPKGKTISEEAINSLVKPVTNEEIRLAINSGSSNSASGPDGYNFDFYKKNLEYYWPSSLAKATAIALVPKISHAENLQDFRPISLCNVFHKIIAKILAARMKNIMPDIIEINQAAFIPNRVISDNSILAMEIINLFKKNYKLDLFCAKYDIMKAFDTVSRKFLFARMDDK